MSNSSVGCMVPGQTLTRPLTKISGCSPRCRSVAQKEIVSLGSPPSADVAMLLADPAFHGVFMRLRGLRAFFLPYRTPDSLNP